MLEAGVEGFEIRVSCPLNASASGRDPSGATVGDSVVKGRCTADGKKVEEAMRGNG